MLSKRQKEILIGTILGDGHLEKNGNGVRLRVDHGMSQTEYLKWKYEELKNLATNKPRVIRAYHKRNKKFYERLHFSTFSNCLLEGWRNRFYQGSIKVIPKDIDKILISPLYFLLKSRSY